VKANSDGALARRVLPRRKARSLLVGFILVDAEKLKS
jgi:hypothetical protein